MTNTQQTPPGPTPEQVAAADAYVEDAPPTQTLMLAVLGARSRLGEHLWTFDTNVLPAGRALEKAGLVTLMHGITERTFRAALTGLGLAVAIDDRYRPPVLDLPADDQARVLTEGAGPGL